MDLITIVVELLFGLLFVSSLVTYLRRRDPLSRDVMLIFGSVAMLFVLVGLGALIGPLPPPVLGAGFALLLAQPILTLRLANKLRPVPRPVLVGAAVAYLVTAVPLVFVPIVEARMLLLAGVAAFIVVDLLAAAYLAFEARRRVGSARVRLGAAAAGSALLALALGLAMLGGGLPVIGPVMTTVGRVMALASVSGFALAFLPPAWVRRVWSAIVPFEFMQHLMDAPPGESASMVWSRLADVALRTTGSSVAMVVMDDGQATRVAAVSAETGVDAPAVGTQLGAVPAARDDQRQLLAGDGELGRLAHAIGASLVTVLPFELADGERGALVLFRQRPSLFAADDHATLRFLIARASVFAERTQAIAEQAALAQRLAVTVAALEQASQAKSDFLASMSHELRTPLSAIIGFSALMRDEPLLGDRRSVPDEWIQHVHRSGDHLLALINDVLDLTKIEAGRIELSMEDFDLSVALAESVEGLRPLAARKRIEMTLDAEHGLIHADRGRLRQIVYNLLSNAIKFTLDDGRISVQARWSGNEARIAVSDSGVGIGAADLDHIFEEFRQVGDTKARETGTGLGLALSRRLVEAHGGRIDVTSQPGVGSRFEVVLPGVRLQTVSDAMASAPVVATRAAGPRILVIEDDVSAVRLLRTYLETEGYHVEVATHGEDGLAAARAHPPDAIVLDVLLPGMDGWEVLRRLKADAHLRDIPVVIVSVVDERNVGMSLGAADYFLKPVSRDALLARLGRYTFTTKVKQRTVRVLVIDDDPAARELVASVLRPEGFEVVLAESGRQGVDLARATPPDLVICDLVMPDMDGFEVVSRLRDASATSDATILILTGHELSSEERERLNGRVADIVQKNGDPRAAFAAWLRRAAIASDKVRKSPAEAAWHRTS